MKKSLYILLVFIACSGTEASIEVDEVENWEVEVCDIYINELGLLFQERINPAFRTAYYKTKIIRDYPGIFSKQQKDEILNDLLLLEKDFESINKELKRYRPDEKNRESFLIITKGIDEYQKAIQVISRGYDAENEASAKQGLEMMESAENEIEKGRSLRYILCEY